jgi:competence protein ComFC
MESKQKIIGRLWKFIGDILFPPVCLNCKKSIDDQENFLCQFCFDEIELNSSLYCPKCARRISQKSQCHQTNYLLAPATRFNPPIPALIYAFKYNKMEKVSVLLSALLISYLKTIKIDLSEYVITFVPLYKSKERARGFNQAQILAEKVCQYFSTTPIKVLEKIKNNPPQAKIKDYLQREKNIAQCFRVVLPQAIAGKNVIIVDDVSTSGATLNEISLTLKKYGAKKIIGLVVAKA